MKMRFLLLGSVAITGLATAHCLAPPDPDLGNGMNDDDLSGGGSGTTDVTYQTGDVSMVSGDSDDHDSMTDDELDTLKANSEAAGDQLDHGSGGMTDLETDKGDDQGT